MWMMMKLNLLLVQLQLLIVAVLTIAVAQEGEQQCFVHEFDSTFIPGRSCEDIYNKNSQSHNMSGYYWITDGLRRVYCGMSYTGLSCEDIYSNNLTTRDKSGYYRITNNEWVFCNMTDVAIAFSVGDLISSCVGMGGVWKRIASLNVTEGDDCPSPWVKSSNSGISFCIPASNASGCYSVNYSTNGVSYQRVCGRASAYQKASPDGFPGDGFRTIDENYVDGISITHGNPRQHIWSYGIGVVESGPDSRCPCAAVPGPKPSEFVGSHYYCESGNSDDYWRNVYYLSDVLWDGAGCSANNTCCSNPNQPWFYRELNITTQDDIEVRSCMNEPFENEAVLITNLELYVQ